MGAALEIVQGAPTARRRSKSYFEGCSNGGREALMNVQRYPNLFDGVIARAPAYNWVGFMGQFNRTAKALTAPGGAITPAKTATLANAVRAACDSLDGVADGVVSNLRPATTTLDTSALRCAGGADTGNTCLSDAAARRRSRRGRRTGLLGRRHIHQPGLAADRQRGRPRRMGAWETSNGTSRRCSSCFGHDGQELPGARPGGELADLRLGQRPRRAVSRWRR